MGNATLMGIAGSISLVVELGMLIWVLVAARGRARLFGGLGLGLMLLPALLSPVMVIVGFDSWGVGGALTILLRMVGGILVAVGLVASRPGSSEPTATDFLPGQAHNAEALPRWAGQQEPQSVPRPGAPQQQLSGSSQQWTAPPRGGRPRW